MSDPTAISPFSTIPQEITDELIAIGQQMSAQSWRVGDLTNQAYELVLANHADKTDPVSKLQVCSWAGKKVGKSGRTVRGYAAVAAFFPANVRAAYEDLPFSHFRFAMQFRLPANGIPGWQKVLDKSMEYMQERGDPPSVDSLEQAFQAQIDDHNAALHHDELPAGPIGAVLPDVPESLPPGWTPIYTQKDAESVDAADKNIYPQTPLHPDALPDAALAQELKAAVTQISSLVPPVLVLLEKMVKFPEFSWAKFFQVEVARVGVRMRQISEVVDQLEGVGGSIYVPSDEVRVVREAVDEVSDRPPTGAAESR